MDRIFRQPQTAFDVALSALCWGLLVLSRLAYSVFETVIAPAMHTPFALILQTLLLVAISIFAFAPAMRDIRDMLFYEWVFVLLWNIAYLTKSDWYEPNWAPLLLVENWMSILAAIRLVWYPRQGGNKFITDWPVFGLLGFATRHRYAPLVPPTTQSRLLVWSLILITYPLAWYVSEKKYNITNAWLFAFGTFVICFYGKKTALALRDHITQSLQTKAELADILPQFEALKTALINAAANHPPIRTHAEALAAMQKWLSEDERAVLEAMRRTHPRMIPTLVDSILNLAGNAPRPPITLVPKKDED